MKTKVLDVKIRASKTNVILFLNTFLTVFFNSINHSFRFIQGYTMQLLISNFISECSSKSSICFFFFIFSLDLFTQFFTPF